MSAMVTQPSNPKGLWFRTVGTALAVQWGVVLTVALCAIPWGGVAVASAAYGGSAVALANSLLALWLTVRMQRSVVVSPGVMWAGELFKLSLTVALLVIVANRVKPLSGMALIVGVIAALKAQWLALWFTKRI